MLTSDSLGVKIGSTILKRASDTEVHRQIGLRLVGYLVGCGACLYSLDADSSVDLSFRKASYWLLARAEAKRLTERRDTDPDFKELTVWGRALGGMECGVGR